MSELRHSQFSSQRSDGPPKIAPIPTQAISDDELEPIDLVDDEGAKEASKKIKAFGIEGAQREHQWKRKPHLTGRGAVRVRSFHGKMSDQGLNYLDDAINEWLDKHPEVEVKYVTSTVGVFEGKIREPALVLNLWY